MYLYQEMLTDHITTSIQDPRRKYIHWLMVNITRVDTHGRHMDIKCGCWIHHHSRSDGHPSTAPSPSCWRKLAIRPPSLTGQPHRSAEVLSGPMTSHALLAQLSWRRIHSEGMTNGSVHAQFPWTILNHHPFSKTILNHS